ncbi:TetR family transcriptional regulator [Epidermidibacterium keratini]|uniref:TetR family transcriptional regulator n=1 Tax=Epidermidibacterium keratini TaxID=1891644 RepID=A0A7L4YMC2_9ACTN|nr:TetR/AcrR family transcriptional regulator [Epidermidibacterium keratini]QHC00431.1 TetR family transcriptional regulator [Epidermidibacterium keratini]
MTATPIRPTNDAPVAADAAGTAKGDKGGKSEQRRIELAESALLTLSELGYARTSLREIAQNSTFSHGVLHYYFKDKTELIVYCVRHYKQQCVHRYDDVIATSTTPQQLRTSFAAKLVESIVDEGHMHRLWYDLRSQSLFDADLRDAVELIDDSIEEMVGRVIDRLAELSGVPAAVDHGTAYAMFDGIFEQALLDHHADKPDALTRLTDRTLTTLELLVPKTP